VAWAKERALIGKRGPTQPELRIKEALDELMVNYRSQFVIGRYVIDYYLPDFAIALEADGDYWHSLPKARANDNRKDAHLASLGITVIRVTETEIHQHPSLPTFIRHHLQTKASPGLLYG